MTTLIIGQQVVNLDAAILIRFESDNKATIRFPGRERFTVTSEEDVRKLWTHCVNRQIDGVLGRRV